MLSILAVLPSIISAIGDINAVVNGVKSAGSIYAAIKDVYPDVAKMIDDVGNALPPVPGASDADHKESIARALFLDHAWTAEQQQAWWDRASGMNDV